MSGGVPLQHFGGQWYQPHPEYGETTHIAYPEPYAAALEAVAEATGAFIDEREAKYDSPKKRAMRAALDRLREAQTSNCLCMTCEDGVDRPVHDGRPCPVHPERKALP